MQFLGMSACCYRTHVKNQLVRTPVETGFGAESDGAPDRLESLAPAMKFRMAGFIMCKSDGAGQAKSPCPLPDAPLSLAPLAALLEPGRGRPERELNPDMVTRGRLQLCARSKSNFDLGRQH